jgi:glycosyltransferase involved in cell wall biosynthesis
MILFLHNRYRTTGGEERAVEDLLWLVREHLGEPAQLLARDSVAVGRARAAAGLLRGGLAPEDVSRAVRLTHARIVHAHNLHPTLGWRALAAARAAGARVVLHLHQYRLVCAIGVCYTHGAECTRCHGRNTLPGVRLNCRGSVAEATTYALALSLWQRRVLEQVDAVVVPSEFARARLRELGAPLPWERVHVLAPPLPALDASDGAPQGADEDSDPGAGAGEPEPARSFALVVSRLAPEKGVDVAIAACREAGVPLVVAGDGPDRARLEALAVGADVRFIGRVQDAQLHRLRRRARLALVPSRSGESFGIAAAEAIAAGLPVAGSRAGALSELLEEASLAPPGDAQGLAAAIARVCADPRIAERERARVRALCAPQVVARALAAVYDGVAGP